MDLIMYTRVIKWVFLCKIPDLCSKNWTDTCAVCLAIEGTQGASATLGRPATHMTGHIFTTISHISSGLRPCALVDSGMVLFTFATLHLDLAVHNPLDWFILPHELKQLDIFSAGQQHTELQKHHLKPNYLLFEQQQKLLGKIFFWK